MIVDDDGCGFPSTDAGPADIPAKRLGLLGIRERVSLVSGTLEVESTPGRGSTILIRMAAMSGQAAAKLRAFLADDHPLVLARIKSLKIPSCKLIGDARDGLTALRMAKHLCLVTALPCPQGIQRVWYCRVARRTFTSRRSQNRA